MKNKFKNLIIYILRYLNILNFNYNLKKKIDFGSEESSKYFTNSLKKINNYFEIGSGSSTYLVDSLGLRYLSIEGDKSFYNYLKKKNIKKVSYINIGPTKYFSYPILPYFIIKNKVRRYTTSIKYFIQKYNATPELILIDGRFRVLCTLNTIEELKISGLKFNTKIIIDDYINRKNYHCIEEFVQVKKVGRFGVFIIDNNTKINFKKINLLPKKVLYNSI